VTEAGVVRAVACDRWDVTVASDSFLRLGFEVENFSLLAIENVWKGATGAIGGVVGRRGGSDVKKFWYCAVPSPSSVRSIIEEPD
jgi:hypothetical protein